MAKKDTLKAAMGNFAGGKIKNKKHAFAPITPLNLDEQPNCQKSENNIDVAAIAPKKNIKAKLSKRKWGIKRTHRFSFEITDDLHEKLNKRIAEIQLVTGKKVSTSEVIRQALARELREL